MLASPGGVKVRKSGIHQFGREVEMPRYREGLPQLAERTFLTDGGLETWLVFIEGVDLPCFAAFPLVTTDEGRARLMKYYTPFVQTAHDNGMGFILDTPTWRANPDWGMRLGYSATELAEANRQSVALVTGLRDAYDTQQTPVVINGVLGPRGDGYRADARMKEHEAERYHLPQIETFRETDADMVSALTLTYSAEAAGIVFAARKCGLPAVISFTVETDGRLPSGEELGEAIARVDTVTDGGPVYYMVNCAHPTHLGKLPITDAPWRDRVRGFRANASAQSHAELDSATVLDAGNPQELGSQYKKLREQMPRLSVLGGCCGTDHTHIVAICEACALD
jgi:S-methylmethionine-dependent homocysteine/selenocysteine methylase